MLKRVAFLLSLLLAFPALAQMPGAPINVSQKGGGGTVTSVGGGGLVTGGPVTSSGTLAVTASTNAQGQAGTDTTTAMTPASTAAAIAALAPSTPAFKNLIIGGDFTTNPWQRGTSFNSVAAATYGADRWVFGYSTIGSGVFNIAQTADAPTQAQAGTTATDSWKVTVGTAATGTGAGTSLFIYQPIEALNFGQLGFGAAGANSVTLSFWVKTSVTGTYSASLQNNAGDRSYPVNFTVGSANTWTKISITIPGDTTGTWPAGTTAGGAYLFIILHTGSTHQGTNATWNAGNYFGTSSNSNTFATTLGATFQLALVQLEAGSSATSFENLPVDVVLARCRRYAIVGNFYVPSTIAQNLATLNMRATPTITGGGSGFTSTGTTANSLIGYQTTGAVQTLTLISEL